MSTFGSTFGNTLGSADKVEPNVPVIPDDALVTMEDEYILAPDGDYIIP